MTSLSQTTSLGPNHERHSMPLMQERQTRSLEMLEPFILSFLAFLMALSGGVYLAFVLHVINSDALTRVLNAYYTIFSPKFHLAAMGFVWNPLPSIVELPIVLFHHWFPALITDGFAANLMSSVSSAFGMYFLNRILFYVGIPRFWRIVYSLIYALNPLIWLYSSNGMSEAMMIATMLGALHGAVRYLDDGRHSHLISAGLWLAACFGARYEAVPFGALVGLALLLALYLKGYSASRIQADLIVAGLPLIFAGLVWVFLNWTIMGNPLYFMNSAYSNASQIGTGSYNDKLILRDAHHLFYSLQTVAHFSFLFPPAIVGLAGALLVFAFSKKRRGQALLFVAALLTIPLFQVVMIYKHASAIWSRFFITYIPFGILLVALLMVVIAKGPWLVRHFLLLVSAAVLLGGNYVTFHEIQTPIMGKGVTKNFAHVVEGLPASQAAQNNGMTQGKIVANYINEHPHLVVLLDTFDSFSVVPFIKDPKQVVITSDLNFQSLLLNPRGRVSDFLVPNPGGVGALDAINRTYPGLWQGKVAWAKETKQFSGNLGYKLFSIGSSAP
ncbi:hypothetical protein [Alicyclobacillus sp. SO9]|uniref:hypothetical protein n=1 Tax=Alicyclobacillus sp. SO9 TaxID=2665646 RepID=UPI0018E75C12|nr:hypothetical protein [Alicyclobacillus sp. SO9]QQE79325.1 hypothetical protein GI364_02100 [Alicyclobacillus sp. SO9]